ncbi:polyprenyl synthetase family protein [Streptacidiphilus pinicola]|uniref:Polyprenyl synthetase family protein n=1 Tax=Streptacidiphilus pinicola TaxID=2219663 RepID=A0A2X0I984_9ACTN|nr:polyprenyl synthetase family protein [Streptacidiphilus pinicola]RAG81484.1 polyprenyl synthetase family protein [Streptacidiphilus pinicola]
MSLAQSAPAPVVGNPVDAEWLRQRVDGALDTFLTGQERTLLAISPQLGPVCGTVRDFLLGERPTGRKRLRAAFCYWGWRGAGGAADEHGAVAAAAALELLQASALVHDDLMDHSDTRRGLPSVHRRFESLHRGSGWHGDAAQFGGASAVLVGDLLLVWCDALFSECGLPRDAVRRAKPLLDLMRTEVMAGQYLDMLEPAAVWPAGEAGAVERARTVIEYKSAKYTVQRPLQLGGLLADASADLTDAYGAFGLPLGEAFQLRDDLLGVYGDPAVTGKPAGDDLREGKRTLLVAETLASCSTADARLLNDLLGAPGLDADGVERLRDVITRSGAPRRIEDRIVALREQALETLASAPIREPQAREVLRRLVDAATARRH